MWVDKGIVLVSMDKMPVVIIRDDLRQPVMYIPVRTDFRETDEEALKRADRICRYLTLKRPGKV